jgi:lipoic acid synthetase/lipoate-protein ligase A
MKYIALPANENRQLSFYLAMEEYVARHMQEPDCFFMWQVAPTVIFGRNQVVENEVNLNYCREHDIRVVRRKSGGGCVYADMDNLMLSMITDGDNVGFIFNRFVTMIQLVLHKMGVNATSTTHNDIMIGDRKVCGTAFYQLPGRSIVHSTMLYDTNMQHMLNAITPSAEKLEKKGIQSVRQRITLLKEHTQLSLNEIKRMIRDTLCDGELVLTAEQVTEIEKIEQSYLKQDFIHLIQ